MQPGVVLDQLNAQLRAHGLWFPVDVSTSAQATIGGMAGNNSCGSRSIRYGNMVHNVFGHRRLAADGEVFAFGPAQDVAAGSPRSRGLIDSMRRHRRSAKRPRSRRAGPEGAAARGGYNLDMVLPRTSANLAQLLAHCSSAPKVRWVTSSAAPPAVAVSAARRFSASCHFPTFYRAMDRTQHIVELGPDAVELVDRTMIDLALANPAFRPVVERSSAASRTRSCWWSSRATIAPRSCAS